MKRAILRGGSTADEQRKVEVNSLHFTCHVNHLIQWRRYQPRQANEIYIFIGPHMTIISTYSSAQASQLNPNIQWYQARLVKICRK